MIHDKLVVAPRMKGHVKLQLFEDGQCVKETEENNFIGNPLKHWMLAMAGGLFAEFVYKNGKSVGMPAENVVSHIALTDNAAAVATDELNLPGNIIGWANIDGYVGADTLRGTINIQESHFDFINEAMVLVFDWPTNAANGTFQTVGFTRLTTGANSASNDPELQLLPVHFRSGIDEIAINGDTLYFTDDEHLYSFDITSGIETSLGTLNWYSGYKGILYYDNKIWYLYDAGGIYDYLAYFDLSTQTNTIVQTNMSYGNGYDRDSGSWCTTDGTYIYIGHYYSGTYSIHRFNMDGTFVDYKNVSSGWASGIRCVVNNAGWLMRGDGTELNISDLFDSGIETTRNLLENLNLPLLSGQILKYGSHWLIDTTANIPRPYESSYDSGLADYSQGMIAKVIGRVSLGTCAVLASPVTKNDTQTMKVTYTLSVTLP
ncbi:hypothetical protein [Phosphitispora sp. TUW77]|uniref:hypothetical protein n=1 Tax=Phosphitispora sp. TUW77 TaxID=3152361 RepID=UPI003AB7BB9D